MGSKPPYSLDAGSIRGMSFVLRDTVIAYYFASNTVHGGEQKTNQQLGEKEAVLNYLATEVAIQSRGAEALRVGAGMLPPKGGNGWVSWGLAPTRAAPGHGG